MDFHYLLARIEDAPFESRPFRHLFITDFLSPDHFRQIVSAPEVVLPPCTSDQELVKRLASAGYEPIVFPGTTNSVNDYLEWHRTRSGANQNQITCEGLGIVFRLKTRTSPILEELHRFIASETFLGTLGEKFGIDIAGVTVEHGLQKYLDGYEISPHPDIRKKALTWMVNVNPAPDSERINYHTHYMEFVPERRYVMEYWRHNLDADTCWVPWGWCTTVTRQTPNNSIVVFKPACDTMHAVIAKYDHLATQRTQFYGNLWYRDVPKRKRRSSRTSKSPPPAGW